MTYEDRENFWDAKVCHICNQELGDDKVKDHCHLTGKYRGAAHNKCNREFRVPKFFPVIFHNGSGYDFHLFIKTIAKYAKNIKCIPKTDENYISFSMIIDVYTYTDKKTGKVKTVTTEIRFLDSYKYLLNGLETLVDNLGKGAKNINEFRQAFPRLPRHFPDDKQFDLVTQKGAWPYEYLNKIEVLDATKPPSINELYSRLKLEHISEKLYNIMLKQWVVFVMKTMRDLLILYNKTDVLQLAVFSNFRNIIMNTYGLEALWHYTVPGITEDVCYKMTGQEIEPITDNDMFLMTEECIRRGQSFAPITKVVANNKFMKEYNKEEEKVYVIYKDMNNLYGCAMSLPLPIGNYQWVPQNKLDTAVDNKLWLRETGLYEVEIEVSKDKECQDYVKDFPPLPECKKIKTIINDKENINEKLITTLYNKDKYIAH